MLKKFKEIKMTGMERVVVETIGVMIFVNAVYLFVYWFSGSVGIAAVAAALAAVIAAVFTAVLAATVAFDAFAALAAAAAFAFSAAAAFSAATGFVFSSFDIVAAAVFAVLAIVFAADSYKVKNWEVLSILIIEAGLLFVVFILGVPYMAIILLLATIVVFSVMLLRKKNAIALEKVERR